MTNSKLLLQNIVHSNDIEELIGYLYQLIEELQTKYCGKELAEMLHTFRESDDEFEFLNGDIPF